MRCERKRINVVPKPCDLFGLRQEIEDSWRRLKRIADSKDENETFPSVFVLTQHFHVLNPPFQWDVKA